MPDHEKPCVDQTARIMASAAQSTANSALSLGNRALEVAFYGTNLGQAGITLANQANADIAKLSEALFRVDGYPPRIYYDVYSFFVVNPLATGKWEATWNYQVTDPAYQGHYLDYVYMSVDNRQWQLVGSVYNDSQHRLVIEPVPYTKIRFAIAGFRQSEVTSQLERVTNWRYWDGVGD